MLNLGARTSGRSEANKLRIAVISPFVDRRHGTERAVAELIERLTGKYGDEVDLYAQSVNDVGNLRRAGETASAGGKICWHQVGQFPGPLWLGFRGWLWLNRRARAREVQRSGKKPEVTFSPGINALDADVMLVHA